jgi:hypothetical protein
MGVGATAKSGLSNREKGVQEFLGDVRGVTRKRVGGGDAPPPFSFALMSNESMSNVEILDLMNPFYFSWFLSTKNYMHNRSV